MTQTKLTMKKYILIVSLFTSLFGLSQNLPIDFEGSVTTANFIDFDGGTGSVIPNPFPTGNNTSNTVGQNRFGSQCRLFSSD
jgi:hypothetical protein